MLMISFTMIIIFKQTSIRYNMKFPSVDCTEVLSADDSAKNLHKAGLEFLDWNVNPDAPLNGALQCFCDNERKTLGPQKWIAEFKYKSSYAIKDIDDND